MGGGGLKLEQSEKLPVDSVINYHPGKRLRLSVTRSRVEQTSHRQAGCLFIVAYCVQKHRDKQWLANNSPKLITKIVKVTAVIWKQCDMVTITNQEGERLKRFNC